MGLLYLRYVVTTFRVLHGFLPFVAETIKLIHLDVLFFLTKTAIFNKIFRISIRPFMKPCHEEEKIDFKKK
jgi:hypothetical protein